MVAASHVSTRQGPMMDFNAALSGLSNTCSELLISLIKTRRQLDEKKRLVNIFLKNTPADIALFDKAGNFLALSDRYCETLGFGAKREEILTKNITEMFPNPPPYWMESMVECVTQGHVMKCRFPEGECVTLWNGNLKCCTWEIHPWLDEQDQIGGFLLISEDIVLHENGTPCHCGGKRKVKPWVHPRK